MSGSTNQPNISPLKPAAGIRHMEKALALTLLLLFTLLITQQRCVDGQVFCRSQISLANEACGLRNFPGATVPRQLLNESSTSTAATTDGGREHELRSGDDDDDDDDDDDEEEEEEEQGRHHHHRRGRRRSADNSGRDPYDTACCRRLMSMDSACVCLAAARLPLFMTSVRHVIILTPEDGCDVSFECPRSSPLG